MEVIDENGGSAFEALKYFEEDNDEEHHVHDGDHERSFYPEENNWERY